MSSTTIGTRPDAAQFDFNEDVPKTGTLSVSDESLLDDGSRLMTLNMGPQHPSTHGVLRVILKLDGEVITDCDPVLGYLHRGVEKLGEAHRYAQVIPWTDRTDYVAAPMNNLGCVMAIEKLCGCRSPGTRAVLARDHVRAVAAWRRTSSGWARTRSISGHSRCRSTASASAS